MQKTNLVLVFLVSFCILFKLHFKNKLSAVPLWGIHTSIAIIELYTGLKIDTSINTL